MNFVVGYFKRPWLFGLSTKVLSPLLHLEVARTQVELARGLMRRTSLNWDSGMLFDFPALGLHPIWMKDTSLTLDVAWLDERMRIIGMRQLRPFDERSSRPERPAKYVIEMLAGAFKRHDLRPGDSFEVVG